MSQASTWNKHPEFVVRMGDPFSGGPPLALLPRSRVTPTEWFFVRNHGAVPLLDPASWELRVEGLVERPLRASLGELQTTAPKTTLEATLQCAGNRRAELMGVRPIPGEVGWGAEAIGTAAWGGVRLRDVLEHVGLRPGAAHVAFAGADEVAVDGTDTPFGASIPLRKALRPEVLLAYEMNAAPLPRVHGYPLRVIVPAYIGARSVKWLTRIEVRDRPTDNHFQTRSYRLIGSDNEVASAPMLSDAPLNAVICQPAEGARMPTGPVEVQGYATAYGGALIEQVELSADGGASWIPATLGEADPCTWRLWSARLSLTAGRYELIARAQDSLGRTQPAHLADVWNPKGYVNCAWHRVKVEVLDRT